VVFVYKRQNINEFEGMLSYNFVFILNLFLI
jgi:hypothetical protein